MLLMMLLVWLQHIQQLHQMLLLELVDLLLLDVVPQELYCLFHMLSKCTLYLLSHSHASLLVNLCFPL